MTWLTSSLLWACGTWSMEVLCFHCKRERNLQPDGLVTELHIECLCYCMVGCQATTSRPMPPSPIRKRLASRRPVPLHGWSPGDHFQVYASVAISEKVRASLACAIALLGAMRPLPGLCICDQLGIGCGIAGLCHRFSGCYGTLLIFTTCASGLCHCPTSPGLCLQVFAFMVESCMSILCY